MVHEPFLKYQDVHWLCALAFVAIMYFISNRAGTDKLTSKINFKFARSLIVFYEINLAIYMMWYFAEILMIREAFEWFLTFRSINNFLINFSIHLFALTKFHAIEFMQSLLEPFISL